MFSMKICGILLRYTWLSAEVVSLLGRVACGVWRILKPGAIDLICYGLGMEFLAAVFGNFCRGLVTPWPQETSSTAKSGGGSPLPTAPPSTFSLGGLGLFSARKGL